MPNGFGFKLSVVVPVSNMAGKLQNLEKSLRSCTSEIQIIIVHDYRDENTRHELKELIKKFPEIEIQFLEGTFGSPGAARNVGMQHANGEWLTFWDSDDIGYGNILLNSLAKTKVQTSLLIGQFQTFNLNSQELSIWQTRSLKDVAKRPGIWRAAFRNKNLVPFEKLSMGEDQLFLLQNMPIEGNIEISDDIFYMYFIENPNQLTKSRSKINDISQIISKAILFASNFQGNKALFQEIVLRLIYSEIRFANFTYKTKAIRQLTSLIRESRKIDGETYISLTGGLGNQLFQLAAAMNFADPKKPILISSLGAPRSSSRGKPDIFDLNLEEVANLEFSNTSTWLYRKTAGFSLRIGVTRNIFENNIIFRKVALIAASLVESLYIGRPLYIVNGQGVGYSRTSKKFRNNLLIGYFQSYRWLDNEAVRTNLNLLKLKFETILLNEARKRAAGKAVLLIHIRLGDYKSESAFGILSPAYFQNALDQISRVSKFDEIWIFSDEPNLVERFYKFKSDLPLYVVPSVDASPAETLEIMRLCSGYIIANSSFSWWGAMLSHASQPVVIAPDQWFVNMDDPVDLIPPSWRKLPAQYIDPLELIE